MNLSPLKSTLRWSKMGGNTFFGHPAIHDYCYYHFEEGLALSRPGFRHESSSCITLAARRRFLCRFFRRR